MGLSFAAVLMLFAMVPFWLTLRRSQAADSPWLWAYLFGMFALAALAFAAPKYVQRQRQIEEQFVARENAARIAHGNSVSEIDADEDDVLVPLWPLYAALSAMTVTSWGVYWIVRQRRPAKSTSESPS